MPAGILRCKPGMDVGGSKCRNTINTRLMPKGAMLLADLQRPLPNRFFAGNQQPFTICRLFLLPGLHFTKFFTGADVSSFAPL